MRVDATADDGLGTTSVHPPVAEDVALMAERRAAAAATGGEDEGGEAGPRDRAGFDAMIETTPGAPGLRYEPGTVGGVPGWWCKPDGARPGARLLFAHGGGYVLGSAFPFRKLAGQIASRARADAFVPDYPLAPEHPFPAAVDAIWAAYRGLAQEVGAAIVLAGDSAGGGLALAVLSLAARDGSVRRPCGAAVLSPWIDLALTGDSMWTRADADPMLSRNALAGMAAEYLDGADPTDWRASPLHAPQGGLPPVRIDVGEDEVLLDDARRYAEAARTAGVAVTLAIWQGMPHVFQSGIGTLGTAELSLDAIGRFLAERLGAALDTGRPTHVGGGALPITRLNAVLKAFSD